jgi:hypothetical protein
VAMGSDVVITGASVSDNYRIVKDANNSWPDPVTYVTGKTSTMRK